MKNYLNYDILRWYSIFAILADVGMDKFGGFWGSNWMHYIIMVTLAYLIVGIIWWLIKHWKKESRRHKIILLCWLLMDALTLVMDTLGRN